MTNISESYDVNKSSWFSPIEIINRFESLRSIYGDLITSQPEFKKAREMFIGAVTLLGAYELSPSNNYWLQLNRQSNSPDVMAGKQTERKGEDILLEIAQMEIVEFEEHFPSNSIIEFLKKTKLSSKKSYDENTMIVCMVNKIVPIEHKFIHDEIVKLSPNSTIYIVGRPYGGGIGVFTIFTPYPIFVPSITYEVSLTSKKYNLPPRVNFHFEKAEKISYKKTHMELTNTYEILGLDENKIKTKFGNNKQLLEVK